MNFIRFCGPGPEGVWPPPPPPNRVIRDFFGETRASRELGAHWDGLLRRWGGLSDQEKIAEVIRLQIHNDLVHGFNA